MKMIEVFKKEINPVEIPKKTQTEKMNVSLNESQENTNT